MAALTAADRCLFIFEARTHLLEVMSSAVPQPAISRALTPEERLAFDVKGVRPATPHSPHPPQSPPAPAFAKPK